MVEKRTLALPYAKAVFEVACESNNYQVWSEILMKYSWIAEDPKVYHLLHNQTLTLETVIDFFLEIGALGNAKGAPLSTQEQNFIRILAYHRRLDLLPFVQQIYETLKAAVEKTLEVEFTSAKELTDSEKENFIKKLSYIFKRTVKLNCSVEKNLIAGFIVRAGDRVIDNSLKGNLDRLKIAMGG